MSKRELFSLHLKSHGEHGRVLSSKVPVSYNQLMHTLSKVEYDWDDFGITVTQRESNMELIRQVYEQVASVFQYGGILTVSGLIFPFPTSASEPDIVSAKLKNFLNHAGAIYGRIKFIQKTFGESTDLQQIPPSNLTYLFASGVYRWIGMKPTIGGSPRYFLSLPHQNQPLSLNDAITGISSFAQHSYINRGVSNCVGMGTIANSIIQSIMIQRKRDK